MDGGSRTKHLKEAGGLIALSINVAGIFSPTPPQHDFSALNDMRHVDEMLFAVSTGSGKHLIIGRRVVHRFGEPWGSMIRAEDPGAVPSGSPAVDPTNVFGTDIVLPLLAMVEILAQLVTELLKR